MQPAGSSVWSRPGSDVYWNEQNQQLRAMLLKRDEELRELQGTLLKQNAELLALKEEQDCKGLSADPKEEPAPILKIEVEPPAESAQSDNGSGVGAVEPNKQELLQQLASLQSHTQQIQEEVNQLRTLVHLRRSPSKGSVKAHRQSFKDATSGLDAHANHNHSPNHGPAASPAAPQSQLWLEFLQWLRAHGIQDMDQFRVFLVAHANKRFLRDLANDICDVDDLPPETPDGLNTPDRRYSLMSSINDIPISDPRPLPEKSNDVEHPPALAWDSPEFEVINSSMKRAALTMPLHASEGEAAIHPSPVVPPLPIHMAQQLTRVCTPTKAKSPRRKALSARTHKAGDIHRPRSFSKHLDPEAGGGSARHTPRGRTLATPQSARDNAGSDLNPLSPSIGAQRRSASTVANATNARGALAERAPRPSPRKASRTSPPSIPTPRPQVPAVPKPAGK